MDRKDDGFVGLGGQVEYQYKVTSVSPPNTEDVVNVTVVDDVYGTIVSGETLAPGESKTFFTTKTLIGTTTNEATVTGDSASDGACQTADPDEVTVTVTQPPPGFFDCSDAKPIDELSMEWAGTQDVCVVAYDGDVGAAVLAVFNPVTPGDMITVSGMSGSPNNQQWRIFADACFGTTLGISEFHISCSDSNMNGVEDCGKNQGDGKDDEPALLNDWLLEGMKGDATLACTPDEVSLPPGGCGLGIELLLALPALMWLQRRRRSLS
jgi:hypothetical protein